MPYHVYILECADKTLYVGSTNDLLKRLHAHNNLKSGAHYTKIRRPVIFRYQEKFSTYSEVRKREGEIKSWTRKKKIEFISKNKKTIRNINPNALTALTLLIAESNPNKKDQMVALVTQMLK